MKIARGRDPAIARAPIEFFSGPHTINGVGTFDLLHLHLNWPGH